MRDHVSAQVARVVETGGALAARERLFSRMRPQVDLEAAVLREAFPTLHAGIRLLAGVNSHVDSQRGLVRESLAAQGTRHGHLTGVSGTVQDKFLAAMEVLATEAAVQRFADRVGEDVVLLREVAGLSICIHCGGI